MFECKTSISSTSRLDFSEALVAFELAFSILFNIAVALVSAVSALT